MGGNIKYVLNLNNCAMNPIIDVFKWLKYISKYATSSQRPTCFTKPVNHPGAFQK